MKSGKKLKTTTSGVWRRNFGLTARKTSLKALCTKLNNEFKRSTFHRMKGKLVCLSTMQDEGGKWENSLDFRLDARKAASGEIVCHLGYERTRFCQILKHCTTKLSGLFQMCDDLLWVKRCNPLKSLNCKCTLCNNSATTRFET